ncbi:rho GTPase-activating protein 12b isoform X9 [Callorhinchus milii]|uniref:rho GTPase-activating protein 12b isoform X9 n=1 Tax=Callorhinchus milii TaxID=7868 RepID=UPI001C3FC343|nr:rho GTPase-activating protein 12b isoform X9 [Callorhinchus milii]
MAEKDGKPNLPIIPGQMWIEVEYDYEYEAKDRKISIKQGEKYILVKKTNNDWWQVKKEETSKLFYLPAQYVKELPRKALMPPVKHGPSCMKSAALNVDTKPLQDSTESPYKPLDYSNSFKSSTGPLQSQPTDLDTSQIHHRDQGLLHLQTAVQDSAKTSTQSYGPGESESQYPRVPNQTWNLGAGRSQSSDSMDGENSLYDPSYEWTSESSGRQHQDSESGDEFSSSSTEQLQHHITDENSRSTFSSYSDNQFDSPPRGWSEEMDERGQTLYVSEYTNEKWMKHTDDQGRRYFYSTDGSKSEWELPQYNISAKQQEIIGKSRSLDRKPAEPLVLTNWRHSTYTGGPLDLEKFTTKKHKRNSSEHLCAPPSYLYSQHPDQESSTSPKPVHDNNNEPPLSPKSPQPSLTEKYGLLNVTKITDNGKKVRKNWTSSWTVLQGSSLLFAKNQGSGWSFYHQSSIPELLLSLLATWKSAVKRRPAVTYVNCATVSAASKFGSNQSKPEFTVDLRGAAIEWASKDKSSKKNVLELRTRQGTELLIQLDNDATIAEWHKALEITIGNQTEPDEIFEDDLPESPGIDKHDKDKNNKDLKKSRQVKSSFSMENADQKKTKTKLKKFLTRRPTLQAVRDKGYIKDQVFGCNLDSLCQRENTTIPQFVKMCIDHVEKEGLDIDGLYRVSGNLAVIQKLRFAVNHDEKLDLKDSKWEDINVITGALKMFFRELPEPLFTYHLFNDFVNAIKNPDYKQRVQDIKELIRQLPKPNHDTMQILFQHLGKIVANGELNRMTTQSVAIVFGPTLLKPEKETGNIAVHMVYQNQIVELILTEYETVFGRS